MKYVYKPRSDWHKRFDMTENKVYEGDWNGSMVYSSDGVYIELINDLGSKIEVHESHLISLDKIRKEKLKELGI